MPELSLETFLPYGRHQVDDDDIAAVADVLRSDWLTTGPVVERFEQRFADFVGARHAVAVANGTAALHLAMLVSGVGPGDEVIVPTLTFAASANCVRYVGGRVVFADVQEDTLLVDPAHVESLITGRTRAIVAVDYAGLPCDLDALRALCVRNNLLLIEDACHAPGATYRGRRVGSIADLSTFSFHPVKHLTTAEGGMVTTDDDRWAGALRRFRNHGIATDHRQREARGTWEYDMEVLGFNYRLNDMQCALGISQLGKLQRWLAHRRAIAAEYTRQLGSLPVELQRVPADREHAWHLFPVRVRGDDVATLRARVYGELRRSGIGVNVHYRPVHLHSYYRDLGYRSGSAPVAERAYDGLLSLPMWHGMTLKDVERVAHALVTALAL